MKIFQYFYLNDKSKELLRGDANYDKLFKVRFFFDVVVVLIKSEYLFLKCIFIDKVMIFFKGRFGMKQYMLQKFIKRGIKVWECVDFANGYVVNFSVYIGKERGMNIE